MIFAHTGRSVVGERIVMALSEDGAAGHGIIGGTIYRPMAERDTDRPLRLAFCGPGFQAVAGQLFSVGAAIELSATSESWSRPSA
jgi:hypothetical protein